jgi:hypothetical protein
MIPLLIAMLAFSPGPSSVMNDDSCDITVSPAATLLLPAFDVNVSGVGETTLFTITNVSNSPQIAHVTVWTDWAYPVLTFNVFLTGYDVQTISLYDVIGRGVVAPGAARPNATIPANVADSGSEPGFNHTNPNIPDRNVLPRGSCLGATFPGTLTPELTAAVRSALTTGLYGVGGMPSGCGTTRVGGTHFNARGYVTVDVVADCTSTLPTDPAYYSTQILFDNVLIGDYQQVNFDPTVGNFAAGEPMVHIRAIPEGGLAGSAPATNLPYTFYDHYTRKPIARWIAACRCLRCSRPAGSKAGPRPSRPGSRSGVKAWRSG